MLLINYLKTYWLKTTLNFNYFIVSMGQKSGSGLPMYFWLGDLLMRLQLDISWVGSHLKTWLGWEDQLSKMVHSHGWQVSASCLQEALIPYYVDLSTGLHDMTPDFSQSEWSERASQKEPWKSHTVTSTFLCLAYRTTLIQFEKRLHRSMNRWEQS